VQHNRGQNVRIALLMNCVKVAMFLGSADTTMDEVLRWRRQGSSRLVRARFVLRQLLFFFLAEVTHFPAHEIQRNSREF